MLFIPFLPARMFLSIRTQSPSKLAFMQSAQWKLSISSDVRGQVKHIKLNIKTS